MCESITIELPSLNTCFYTPNMLKLEQNFAIIAQSAWKLCVECEQVCEKVCESILKYHHWISQLEYLLLDTQHVEIGKNGQNKK